jgi:hypothetical protein
MRLAALTAAGVLASVTVTLIGGSPRALPGVALGSPVLLRAERTLALFAIVVALLSIVRQAARGRLPIELSTSGLRYEAEGTEDLVVAVRELQEQLDGLTQMVELTVKRVDSMSPRS